MGSSLNYARAPQAKITPRSKTDRPLQQPAQGLRRTRSNAGRRAILVCLKLNQGWTPLASRRCGHRHQGAHASRRGRDPAPSRARGDRFRPCRDRAGEGGRGRPVSERTVVPPRTDKICSQPARMAAGIALALPRSSPTTALRYARQLAVGSNAAARVLGKLRAAADPSLGSNGSSRTSRCAPIDRV